MTRLAPHDNALAQSLYAAERMVACSPTWQSLIGTSDFQTARDAICFIEGDTDPATFPRPCCVISNSFGIRYSRVQQGVADFHRPHGDIWVYLALDVPDEYLLEAGSQRTDQAAIRKNQLFWAANTFGDFIQDLVNVSGVDQTVDSDVPSSQLSVPHIEQLDMVRNPEETWPTLGQFWYTVVSLKWGDD